MLTCKLCGETKDESKFQRKTVKLASGETKRYYFNTCLKCAKRGVKRNKRELIDQTKAAGCVRCGEKDPDVLVFHHLEQENRRSSDDLHKGYVNVNQSYEDLQAEIAKCIVLCANCHMREHKRIERHRARG